MNENKYAKWEPIPNLPSENYVEGLHYDYEGFRILLKGVGNQARMLRIAFDLGAVLAYRFIDEGDLLLYSRTDKEVGLGRWGLFIVDDSSFQEWFNRTSQNVRSSLDIVHYAIYTPNDCIDILAFEPPIVEWLN